MSSSRVQAPQVNLKERIAALQQRNAPQRETSPTPGAAGTPGPLGGALREKIEKFEKKGGVPVPRGRFGLGAPPPSEGQVRRPGELYGNRMPAPRTVSAAATISRAGSPLDRAVSPSDNRRSVSYSYADYDEEMDYMSPMSSPGMSSPPESPSSSSASPVSPAEPTSTIIQTQPLARRGTAFATALEIARKAESDMLEESIPPPSLPPTRPSSRGVPSVETEIPEVPPLPSIVVSASDEVPKDLLESLMLELGASPGVDDAFTSPSQADSESPSQHDFASPSQSDFNSPSTQAGFASPAQDEFESSPRTERPASVVPSLVEDAVQEVPIATNQEELSNPSSKSRDQDLTPIVIEQSLPTAPEQVYAEQTILCTPVEPHSASSEQITIVAATPTTAVGSPGYEAISPSYEEFALDEKTTIEEVATPSPPVSAAEAPVPAPAVEAPALVPTAEESAPAPVAETPAPAPAVETPAPAPVAETPAPAPAPVVETPAPAPAPVVETPAPAPAPVVETPASAPTPVIELAISPSQTLAVEDKSPVSGRPLPTTPTARSSVTMVQGVTAEDDKEVSPVSEVSLSEAAAPPVPEAAAPIVPEAAAPVVTITAPEVLAEASLTATSPSRSEATPTETAVPSVPIQVAIPEVQKLISVSTTPVSALQAPAEVAHLHSSAGSDSDTSRQNSLYLDIELLQQTPLSATFPRSALASSVFEGNMSGDLSMDGYYDIDALTPATGNTVGSEFSGTSSRIGLALGGSEKSYVGDETPREDEENVITLPSAQDSSLSVPPSTRDRHTFSTPPASPGFLSPSPASDTLSSSSIGVSSSSSRPMSMIEMSPSRIAHAHRMTPATSRGVPMFVPASAPIPRKSDFVYFPPTPGAERTVFAPEDDDIPPEDELSELAPPAPSGQHGSATIVTSHKISHSYSMPRRYVSHYAEPEEGTSAAGLRPMTFSAVVHGKVKELPPIPQARTPRKLPETPQMRKLKRMTMVEPPSSPGQGELAALLNQAVMLENTLNKGELPSEMEIKEAEERKRRKAAQAKAKAEAQAKAKAEQELKEHQEVFLDAQSQEREAGPSAKLRHTFLIPLAKARSMHHKKDTSTFAVDMAARRDIVRPKSTGIPESSSRAPRIELEPAPPLVPVRRAATPEGTDTPPDVPPKSPRARFPSFRRIGSMRHTHSASNGNVRHSNSTSSELSVEEAVTPPENNIEFSLSEHGHGAGAGHGLSWPSLSPKKSVASIGRAASFAEKMWSRARTKSSTSTLSTYDSGERMIVEPIPESQAFLSIGPPPKGGLPPVPTTIVSPSSDYEAEERTIIPPTRSTSLGGSRLHSHHSPSSASSHTLHADPISPSEYLPSLPQRESLLPEADNRPISWVSVSSVGSLPSPIFSQELFDSFPSVPNGPPLPPPGSSTRSHARDSSYPSVPTPSFDHALLSSALPLTPGASMQSQSREPSYPAASTPSFDHALLSSALPLTPATQSRKSSYPPAVTPSFDHALLSSALPLATSTPLPASTPLIPATQSRKSSFPTAVTPSFDHALLSSALPLTTSTPLPTSTQLTPAASHGYSRTGEHSLTSAAAPSFDHGLLSSAIHLASAQKPAASPATPQYSSHPMRSMTMPSRKVGERQ